MSLYHHVASKQRLLDGWSTRCSREIDVPERRRRLAGGDDRAASSIRGAPAPSVGDRAHGVPHDPGPRDDAASRTWVRSAACRPAASRLTIPPTPSPAGQLHLRLRAPGGRRCRSRLPTKPRLRSTRSSTASRPDQYPHLAELAVEHDFSPATATATSSSSACVSSSTPSRPGDRPPSSNPPCPHRRHSRLREDSVGRAAELQRKRGMSAGSGTLA